MKACEIACEPPSWPTSTSTRPNPTASWCCGVGTPGLGVNPTAEEVLNASRLAMASLSSFAFVSESSREGDPASGAMVIAAEWAGKENHKATVSLPYTDNVVEGEIDLYVDKRDFWLLRRTGRSRIVAVVGATATDDDNRYVQLFERSFSRFNEEFEITVPSVPTPTPLPTATPQLR